MKVELYRKWRLRLLIYLKASSSNVARAYWYGRLDELKRVYQAS